MRLLTAILILAILTWNNAAAQNATVIMTFDDGWYSVLQNAKPIMDSNGQKGAEFIITDQPDLSWNGQPNNYMNVSQLQQLYDNGWDLSSHTVSHVVLTTVNSTALNYELGASKDWLDMHGFTRGSMFLAYPEGKYDANVITAVQANHYSGARTVDNPNGTYLHYNLTSPDVFTIKDYEAVGGIDNDNTIIKQIDNAVAANGLLILSFHKIVDTLSTNITDEQTEFLMSDFQNVSNHLKKLSDNGSVKVTTLSEYFGAIPLPRYMPEVPANITGNLFESQAISWINVSWTEGMGNKTDLYNVYLNGSQIGSGGSGFNFANITVVPREQINFSVYAINTTNGNTLNPTPAFLNMTIPPLQTYMPSTPVNLTSINGNVINGRGSILIEWNDSGVNGGYGNGGYGNGGYGNTDFYNVSVNSLILNGSLWTNGTKNTSYNLSGVVPGIIYEVRIYSVNSTNGTTMNQTPGLINVEIPLYMPPIPIEIGQWSNDLYIYFQWINGSQGNNNNITDFYNYSVNGAWTNLSKDNLVNVTINSTTMPNGIVNVSIYSYNSTNGGVQNPIPLFMYMKLQLDLRNIWAEYDIYAGDTLKINPIIYNPNNDTIRFTTNATLNATIDNKTGAFILNTKNGDQGIYNWNITAYDDKLESYRTINFMVSITTKPGGNSGNNGGGNNGGGNNGGNNGGGGGGWSNAYDPNAETFEVRDSQIRYNVDSTVVFLKNNVVKNVTFHGIRNYGEVVVKVSILKGNPKPSYLNNTYKFFSINLDVIQQQSEYLYINKSIVTVLVNKSNLTGNIIKAYRYVGDSWKPVVIEDTGIENDISKEYKIISDGLSNFVIVLEPIPVPIIQENVQVNVDNSTSLTGSPAIDKVIKKVIPESMYRRLINFIKRYMWWI